MAKRFKHYNVTIGDETFEVCGETDSNTQFYGNDTSEIYREYGRPSSTKVAIWNDWCIWAHCNNAQLKIVGSNCMTFSISGFVDMEDGTRYLLYITKCYNRAYKVVD